MSKALIDFTLIATVGELDVAVLDTPQLLTIQVAVHVVAASKFLAADGAVI